MKKYTNKRIYDFINFINEGGGLFKADRISTSELNEIVEIFKIKYGKFFKKIKVVKFIKSKNSHGDIDLILLKDTNVTNSYLVDIFKNDLSIINVKYAFANNNEEDKSTIHILFMYKDKKVQIDLNARTTIEKFESAYVNLSYGDLTAILGYFSKRIGFKYSLDGFYKTHKNEYILLTDNLYVGLDIMNIDHSKLKDLENLDSLADTILNSRFFDYRLFNITEMFGNLKDLYYEKVNIKYLVDLLYESGKEQILEDYDHILITKYPRLYKSYMYKTLFKNIKDDNRFTGNFVIDTFKLNKNTSGKLIGDILKYLNTNYSYSQDMNIDEIINDVKFKFNLFN